MTDPSKALIPDACFNIDDRLGNLYDSIESDEEDDFDPVLPEERYQIGERVAQGGLKNILSAYDHKSSRHVAIAFLREDRPKVDYEAEFIREAKMSALLEHPNIIPVYDVGYMENPFFTMQLVRGKNLNHHIFDKSLPLSLNHALRIFLKICDAVSYAHSRGIIHLDLKPDNIKIDNFGEVLLHDWGLARRLFIPEDDCNQLYTDKIEIPDSIKGTPSYMAPEQFDPKHKITDERTDIFSLGGILYSLISSKHPFDLNDIRLERQLISPQDRCPELKIPNSLNAVCLKAMSNNPDQRYQTVQELKHEIELYLDGFATEAENASLITLSKLVLQRHLKMALLLTSSFIIILILTITFIQKIRLSESETRQALVEVTESKQATELALRQSESNFALYKQEKQDRQEFNELTTEWTNKLPSGLDKWKYSRFASQLKIALKASPGNQEIYQKLIILHLTYGNLPAAIKIYDRHIEDKNFLKGTWSTFRKYVEINPDVNQLSNQDFVKLIIELKLTQNIWIASSIMHSRIQKNQSLESRSYLITNILKGCNPYQKSWNIKWETREGQVFTFFSLKNHNETDKFVALAGLRIGELDLSGKGEFIPQRLRLTYIKKLNLTGRRIEGPDSLRQIVGLEQVIISRRAISQDMIYTMPSIQFIEVD